MIKTRKAFTLLELMVAVVILTMLVIMVVPKAGNIAYESELKKLQAEATTLENAISTYDLVYGTLPVLSERFSVSDVEAITPKVMDANGAPAFLSEGSIYADVDEIALSDYIRMAADPDNFIIDVNTVEVYFFDPSTNARIDGGSSIISSTPATYADIQALKDQVLLRDGSNMLAMSYDPLDPLDVATKEYVDLVALSSGNEDELMNQIVDLKTLILDQNAQLSRIEDNTQTILDTEFPQINSILESYGSYGVASSDSKLLNIADEVNAGRFDSYDELLRKFKINVSGVIRVHFDLYWSDSDGRTPTIKINGAGIGRAASMAWATFEADVPINAGDMLSVTAYPNGTFGGDLITKNFWIGWVPSQQPKVEVYK